MARPPRSLSLVDCLSIGINGIVGSGIYLLIGPLALKGGAVSIPGIFACGLLCILIALCFAELSGMFDQSGGAYVYARAAFGPKPAFAVAWMSMATAVLNFSAVAAGFAEALVQAVPSLGFSLVKLGPVDFGGKGLVAAALIGVLGVINYRGVKGGARTSDFLSAAKVLPLLALALVGLVYVKPEVVWGMFHASSGGQVGYFGALSSCAFLATFMVSGFEFVPVPAGEATDAKRNVPIAIVGSLIGATALYCLLQTVALSVVPDLSSQPQPLIEAGRRVFGPAGRLVFSLAALLSMAGFCAGSALVAPRYFAVLAEDGYLPSGLSSLSRFQTPGRATVVASILSIGLVLSAGYSSLVDVSNVVLFGQYIPTSLAVIVLRYRMPNAERSYKLPFGPIIPTLAVGTSVLLLVEARPRSSEWIAAAEVLLVGILVWGLSFGFKSFGAARRSGPSEVKG